MLKNYNSEQLFKRFGIALLLLSIVAGALLPQQAVYASDSSDKDNVLIYLNKNGEARGYDLLWKLNESGTYPQESAIMYKDGVAYFTGMVVDGFPGNRDLIAVDVATGQVIDRYEIGSTYASPTIDGNTIYIGTGGESWTPDSDWLGTYGMYSFDITNIKQSGFSLNWYQPITGGSGEPVMVDNSKIYFSQFMGNKIYALNKVDGTQAWVFSTGSTYQAVMYLLHDNYIYATNSYGGGNLLYKIDTTTGLKIWDKPIAGKLWDNSLAYDVVRDSFYTAFYYGSKKIASYGLDGTVKWVATTTSDSLSFTAYHDDVVFFSDMAGYVYARNADDGTPKWTTRIGTSGNHVTDIASPTIAGGLVFIGSKGANYPLNNVGRGAFYILDEETGEILWNYHESDVGDVMAPASIADGKFFNKTNNYGVYAFDMGDGAGDWLYHRYDQDNSAYSPDGLTASKYVTSNCTTAGDVSTCSLENLYSGKAVGTKLKIEGETINYVKLQNGEYYMGFGNDTVYAPSIPSQESITGMEIGFGSAQVEGVSIPKLSNNATTTTLLSSSFNSETNKISLTGEVSGNLDLTIAGFKSPFMNVKSSISSTGTTTLTSSSLSGLFSTNSVEMSLSPSSGSVEVEVINWDSTLKKWTENSTTSNATSQHTLSGLLPNQKYRLAVDGKGTEYNTDGQGVLSFNYEGGYSQHTFEITEVAEVNKKIGSKINYGCKDSKALNYNYFSRHNQNLCKYDLKKDRIEKSNTETNSTQIDVVTNDSLSPDSNLTLGSQGEEVRNLQKLLNTLGFLVSNSGAGSIGNETDYFGPATKAALIKFQLSKLITPAHGELDLKTRTALNEITPNNSVTNQIQSNSKVGEYTFQNDLEEGVIDEDVRSLQKKLNTLGLTISQSGPGSIGNETNIFGPATKAALIKFQLSKSIFPAVGYFGPLTRLALENK